MGWNCSKFLPSKLTARFPRNFLVFRIFRIFSHLHRPHTPPLGIVWFHSIIHHIFARFRPSFWFGFRSRQPDPGTDEEEPDLSKKKNPSLGPEGEGEERFAVLFKMKANNQAPIQPPSLRFSQEVSNLLLICFFFYTAQVCKQFSKCLIYNLYDNVYIWYVIFIYAHFLCIFPQTNVSFLVSRPCLVLILYHFPFYLLLWYSRRRTAPIQFVFSRFQYFSQFSVHFLRISIWKVIIDLQYCIIYDLLKLCSR